MPLEKCDDERTQRNHLQAATANVVESPGHEQRADSLAFHLLVDLDVNEP